MIYCMMCWREYWVKGVWCAIAVHDLMLFDMFPIKSKLPKIKHKIRWIPSIDYVIPLMTHDCKWIKVIVMICRPQRLTGPISTKENMQVVIYMAHWIEIHSEIQPERKESNSMFKSCQISFKSIFVSIATVTPLTCLSKYLTNRESRFVYPRDEMVMMKSPSAISSCFQKMP